MALESLRNSVLNRTLVDLLGDLSDLISKEIRLARAELTEKVQSIIRVGAWAAVAALLCLMVVFFLLEAAVFALVGLGLAAYWACLIVAGLLAAFGAGAIAFSRSAASPSPSRSIRQLNADIRTAKELVT
jgi:hypothetical protein